MLDFLSPLRRHWLEVKLKFGIFQPLTAPADALRTLKAVNLKILHPEIRKKAAFRDALRAPGGVSGGGAILR